MCRACARKPSGDRRDNDNLPEGPNGERGAPGPRDAVRIYAEILLHVTGVLGFIALLAGGGRTR